MRENNVFISGDLWKQYLKKNKKISRVGTSEKKLFAVEPRKKFSFHVLRRGKKKKKNHVSRVSENTVFAAETSKKKYIYTL